MNALIERMLLASLELAALAAGVWLIIALFRLRQPRLIALLWVFVLVKPILSLFLGSPFPIFSIESPVERGLSVAVAERGVIEDEVEVDFSGAATGVPLTIPTKSVSPAEPAREIKNKAGGIDFQRVIVFAWVIGLAVFLALEVLDQVRLGRMIRRASPADARLGERLRAVAAMEGIAHPPAVRVTKDLESPALAGILRPVILIPAWLSEGEDGDKLDWSLRHELMHWKMRDTWANGLRRATRILFFFHPVAWWAGRRWEEAAERACDRALVQSPDEAIVYSEQLYKMLVQIQGRRRPALGNGMFATRSQISRRIAALLGGEVLKAPAMLSAAMRAGLLVVALAILSTGFGISSGRKAIAVEGGSNRGGSEGKRTIDTPSVAGVETAVLAAPAMASERVKEGILSLSVCFARLHEAEKQADYPKLRELFNEANEILDDLQGKNMEGGSKKSAPTAREWGDIQASVLTEIYKNFGELENLAEGCRDLAGARKTEELKVQWEKIQQEYSHLVLLLCNVEWSKPQAVADPAGGEPRVEEKTKPERQVSAAPTVLQPEGESEMAARRDAAIGAGDFIGGLEAEMDRVRYRVQTGHAYADKLDLNSVYENFCAKHNLGIVVSKLTDQEKKKLAQLVSQVENYASQHKDDLLYGWRIEHLLYAITDNMGDSNAAAEHLDRALELYPDVAFTSPSKQSKYQHMVNERAELIWRETGVEAAEGYALERYGSDPKFKFFFIGWWEEAYGEANQTERLPALKQRVEEIDRGRGN